MARLLSQNDLALVNAYADGELDAANSLAIQEKMSRDPALAAEYMQITTLNRLLREQVPYKVAPPGLRARLKTRE